jgi:beta-phosphoglucomutase family hydrolase
LELAKDIQALIFDMDGVIVDSMPYHERAWEIYLSGRGVDPAALNSRMHGKHNDALIREFFGAGLGEAEVRRMGEEKEAIYRELVGPELETALVPGVRRFLAQTAGYAKAVASNAEPRNVRFVLEAAELGQHFRVVLDGYQVRQGKPHPEIYLKSAAALGLEPAACLVFEDSQTGIDAARAAGMNVVAVNTHRTALSGWALEIESFEDPQLEPWLPSVSVTSWHSAF